MSAPHHRTMGQTHTCRGCRYWSEQIAQSTNCMEQAVCLSKDSPLRGYYVAGFQSCDEWASGHLGPIDKPGLPADAYERQPQLQRVETLL